MNELVALGGRWPLSRWASTSKPAFHRLFHDSRSSLIEHRTALGARKSIESLIRITPTKAHVKVVGESGEQRSRGQGSASPATRSASCPGDNIPGDGRSRYRFQHSQPGQHHR
jgi:hypothetical protein